MTGITITETPIVLTVGETQGPAGRDGTNGTNGTIGPQGAPGPSGPSGNAQNVTTVAAFQASSFDVGTKVVNIQGYSTVGAGAMTVRRVDAQPSHGWKFRSTDRYKADGTTDATNGGWWEGYTTTGFITLEQFGCPTDGVSDCFAAWNLANLYCIYQGKTLNVPPPEIFFPAYKYNFSQRLTPGTDPANPMVAGYPVNLRGNYTQQNAFTILNFTTQDGDGIFFSPFCYGGRLKDLYITGPWSTAATQMNSGPAGNGVTIRTLPIIIENCTIYQFSGHGIWVLSGDQGDGYGYTNCDGFRLDRFNISWTGKCGLRMEGPDSQVAQITNGNISFCGLSGIYEAVPYANSYDNVQVSFCGIPFAPGGTPNVALLRGGHGGVVIGSDGKTYMVAPGKDTQASTTNPVGDVTGVWLLVSNSTFSYWETWTSGHQYNYSPTVFSDHAIFDNIYSESTNNFSVPAILPNDSSARGNNTLLIMNGDGYRPPQLIGQNGAYAASGGIGSYEKVPPRNSDYSTNAAVGKILQTFIGTQPQNGYISSTWDEYTNLYSIWQIDRTNKEITLKTDPVANPLLRIGTSATANTYGRAAAVPYLVVWPYGMGNGNSTEMRIFRTSSTFPMKDPNGASINFLPGDVQINPSTTYNAKWGAVCTAAGLDTAATFYNLIAAPVNCAFNSVSTAPTANNLQLTAANISGGINEVTLVLTASLGAGATATLPLVTDLVTALGDKFFPGMTYILWVANASAVAFSWTLTTNTGWGALGGTLTIAQNTMRKFLITIGNGTSGSVQATGSTTSYS